MKAIQRRIGTVALTLVVGALGASAHAQGFVPGAAIINPGLTGTTQYNGWLGLTSANYPGYPFFPGLGAWSAPMAPNQSGSGTALLTKVADGSVGGPYPATGGIYFGSMTTLINGYGGTLAVGNPTPVSGLKNVVFQIQIGEAWTYDFFNHVLPTLSYNGGTQNLPATASTVLDRFYNGTVQMPSGPEDVYINTYLLQWDLSAVGPVTNFSIQFDGVQHAQIYALRLDESDEYAPVTTDGVAAASRFVLRPHSGSRVAPLRDRKATRGTGRVRKSRKPAAVSASGPAK